MKKFALIAGLAAATAFLSTSAFAGGHTNFDSRTGTNSWVEDPVVPNGPHWIGGESLGRDWSTTPPYSMSIAEMRAKNLHDSGYNPAYDFNSQTGVIISQ